MDAAAVALEWARLRPFEGFAVIYADPPWNFSGNSVAKPGKNARRHYPTMKLDEICALPVPVLAADNALLLMWVTSPFAELAFRVVRAWDFRYKSQLVWPKNTVAHGYWARGQHEILYICRRGRFPCELPALFPSSVIPGKVRQHSRKPEWPAQIVEQRFPEAPKIELFSRTPRQGWAAWGNQTDKFAGEAA